MGYQDSRQQAREQAHGVYARIQELSDQVVSRKTRQQFYANVNSFSTEQPYLASFLYIQLALSSLPLLIFAGFSISTILLALGTALSFILFWVGTALLILLPTLFVTISTGLGIWVWGVGSFLLARWLYNLIPVSVRGVAEVDMPNGKTVRVDKTGEGFGDVHARIEPKREHNLGAVSVPVAAPVVVANNY